MYPGTERRRQTQKLLSRGQSITKDTSYLTGATVLQGGTEEPSQTKTNEKGLSRSFNETQRLLQELQVHQIELEMQNAEMCLVRDQVETTLEKYNELYDFAPVGYLTLDRDGAIRAVNLTGASQLGADRSRLLGLCFGLFVAEVARPVFSDFLDKVFSSHAKETCEVGLLKGDNRPLFVQIETVAAASGQECYAAIIDISARRQLEMKIGIAHTEVAARADQLAEANIDLEAFNYSVSHDLCTPLSIINGYSQVLRGLCRDQFDEQSKEYLRGIFEGTLRMKRLIASLLEFSSVTRIELNREAFDLSAMAKSVAEELKQATPESRVTFRTAEGITANGDVGLCRIVLDNLIGNAWKYAVNREGTVIEFGMTELAGEPVYFVSDNGPGFDMVHAGNLFIPFQRIPGIDAAGHGIGLATVKRIVRRHGGRVWAESELGEGANFFFTL